VIDCSSFSNSSVSVNGRWAIDEGRDILELVVIGQSIGVQVEADQDAGGCFEVVVAGKTRDTQSGQKVGHQIRVGWSHVNSGAAGEVG
jgi:hypothetical protein